MTPIVSGGETTRVDELSYLGNHGWQNNFSSYKHFGSPNRDNSRRSECHEMPRLRVESRNVY